VKEVGPLLASGRDSDIYEYGPGLVLRRSRGDRSMAVEARIMEHARNCGYPVPAIQKLSVNGTELVMERIVGPTMLAYLGKRPWTIRSQGVLLADLHKQLHTIPAPGWIKEAPVGAGTQLLHLDLHPNNIVMGPNGPVVIDWANASRGDSSTDVALTWVLLAAASIPAGRIKSHLLGKGRSFLVDSFLAQFSVHEVRAQLAAVVEWKSADPHLSRLERDAARRLLA
jgi:tRNA A-37 threonylcarbamoyl transferase component Bud32